MPVLEKVKEQAITGGSGETLITFSGVEMADMRMLEELGRAKGEKMIEKTLEALKRNQDL